MIDDKKVSSDLIESIANEILNYLDRHPDSADSIDGIAKWWLKKQRFDEAQANVKAAVGLLVSKGKIRKSVTGEGRAIYAAGARSEHTDVESGGNADSGAADR